LAQEAHGGDAHTHIVQGLRQLHAFAVLVTHGAASRQADDLRLHRARLAGGAEVLAVGHHGRRNGAGRWRLNVLVDNLTIDALAVALAVGDVDVVVLVDVAVIAACRLVDRAGVVVRVVRVYGAVDRLIDGAVADIRIEIAVRIFGCAGVGVLVNVRHRARIDVRILVDVGHRASVLVDVGVRRSADVVIVVRVQRRARAGIHVVVRVDRRAGAFVGVEIGVRAGRRAGRRVVVVIRVRRRAGGIVVVRVGGRVGVVRRAIGGRVVDILRRSNRHRRGLGEYHATPAKRHKNPIPLNHFRQPFAVRSTGCRPTTL